MDATHLPWRCASWMRSTSHSRSCAMRPRLAYDRSLGVREILFVAGEPSGDLHTSSVARELVARGAPFRLRGIGGDLMADAGVQLDAHIRELAVLGFVEIIRHIPR